MKFERRKFIRSLYQIRNVVENIPSAIKETIKDKKMWRDWLFGLGVYLGPWNSMEYFLGYEFRNKIHEVEEWINFGIVVPFYFPLSSPLIKFVESLKKEELTSREEYLLRIGSTFAWKGIQVIGRIVLPIIPWEGEATNYPSPIFDNLEKILDVSITESVRDLIRTTSLGSIFSYLKRKISKKGR